MTDSAQLQRDSHEGVTQPLLASVDRHIGAGEYRLALTVLIPLMQAGSYDVPILDRAATCYLQIGDTQAAISLIEVITEIRPELAMGWGKLAALKLTVGDKTGAIRGFRKALGINPNSAYALSALNGLEPFKRDSGKVARLRKLAKSTKLPPSEMQSILNTLGQVEHNSGRPKIAFRFFAKAKAVAQADFKPECMDELVDGQIRHFQANSGTDENPDGPRIVFLVGMPRSGTTLLEQILTRHSQVGTIGESPALTKTLLAVRQHVKNTQRGQNLWDWCDRLTEQETSIFRQYYYECINRDTVPSNDVIVDKMPFNSFHLGLAHTLLPDAKFVFMSRHPLDVGLSNFRTSFHSGNEFSHQLKWIGQMTRSIYRSTQDYQAKLTTQLRVQSYQGLVTNPDIQIKALLEHVGLPWQQDCLSPQDLGGAIRTASVHQVRESINTRALDKWKAYKDQLQPLLVALGGQEWVHHWQDLDSAAAEN